MTVADVPIGLGAAAALVDGRDLLVWGGFCGDGACDAGAILGEGGEWRGIARAGDGRGRAGHEMVAVGGGRVVVAGGLGCGGILVHCTESLVYDATTDSWAGIDPGELDFRRTAHSLAVLGNGEVLLFGGRTGDRTNVYFDDTYLLDVSSGIWRSSASTHRPAARQWGEMVAIDGGAFLMGGGSRASTLPEPAVYHAATDQWRPCASDGAPAPRIGHSLVWTGTEVLVWGGGVGATAFGDGFAYDPERDAWRPLSSEGAPSPRGSHAAAWLADPGAMVIWGGAGTGCGGGVCGDAFAYFPVSDRWVAIETETEHYRAGTYAFATETGLISWGGIDRAAFDMTDGAELIVVWSSPAP